MESHLSDYPSPLEGYEDLPPPSDTLSPDGKSLLNNPRSSPSPYYTQFPSPITNARPSASFDLHIYFHPSEQPYAAALHTRIRHEFPELRIYPLREKPVGPHPVGMFEVNVFSPAELGAIIGFLVVWRGPLSVLVHPNTTGVGENEGDHTLRATWMGQPYPLQTWMLRKLDEKKRAEAANENHSSASL